MRIGQVQTYQYNTDGNVTNTASTAAGESSAEYTGVDITKYTAPNGNATTYTYNSKHDVLTATMAGTTSTYTYDTSGNNLMAKLSGTGGSAYIQTSATMTGDRNHTATTVDAAGNTTTYGYSATRELLTTITNAKGVTTTYAYNNYIDRMTSTYQSGVASVSYDYANGLLSQLRRKTFRSGATQWQHYLFEANAWGQTTKISLGASTGGGTATGTRTLATYTYEDNNGNLTKMTYGNGDIVEYTYDMLDRLVKTTYNDNTSLHYFYSADGALAELRHNAADGSTIATYYFEYDDQGRLIRSTETDASGTVQHTEHIYDAYSRLAAQAWTIGSTAYTESYVYDDSNEDHEGDGALTRVNTAVGSSLNYTYDHLNRLTRTDVMVPGAENETTLFYTAYAYQAGSATNQSTNLVQYRNVRTAAGALISGFKYTYDELGNITAIAESQSPFRTLYAYTYDSQNQLATETHYTYDEDGTTPATTTTYAYTYDTAGNILTVKKNGTTVRSYTYGNSGWNDLLTKVGSHPITYDTIGNPTVYHNGVTEFTRLVWENGRQLVSLEMVPAANKEYTVNYSYDADGIRSQKVVTATLGTGGTVRHDYITQGGKVIRETTTHGSSVQILDFIYDTAGQPYALRYSDDGGSTFETYYYVLNLQGDVIKLIDASANVVAEYSYNAWGEIITATGTMSEVNPLRYRSYYYDAETGFYYLQSRYYDPVVKRFINADTYQSTGQGFVGTNMFAYCGNNPPAASDHSGEIPTFSVMIHDSGDGVLDITEMLNKLMREHYEEMQAYYYEHCKLAAYCYFIEKVKTGGEWDLKNLDEWSFLYTHIIRYNGEILRFDDPGNIHYGYVGQAFTGECQLTIGAGLYQCWSGTSDPNNSTFWGDDPRDAHMISYGYRLACEEYFGEFWYQ